MPVTRQFFYTSYMYFSKFFLPYFVLSYIINFTNGREPQRTRPTGQKLKGPAERDPTSTEHGNAQAVRAEGGCPTKPGCSGKRRDGREGVDQKGKLARHRRGTGRENGGVLRRHPMRGT